MALPQKPECVDSRVLYKKCHGIGLELTQSSCNVRASPGYLPIMAVLDKQHMCHSVERIVTKKSALFRMDALAFQ